MREESLDSRGATSIEGLSASAERTNSRLVRDLDPGSETVPDTAWLIVGANQLFSAGWELFFSIISYIVATQIPQLPSN
jgi:hypothetical protein